MQKPAGSHLSRVSSQSSLSPRLVIIKPRKGTQPWCPGEGVLLGPSTGPSELPHNISRVSNCQPKHILSLPETFCIDIPYCYSYGKNLASHKPICSWSYLFFLFRTVVIRNDLKVIVEGRRGEACQKSSGNRLLTGGVSSYSEF